MSVKAWPRIEKDDREGLRTLDEVQKNRPRDKSGASIKGLSRKSIWRKK